MYLGHLLLLLPGSFLVVSQLLLGFLSQSGEDVKLGLVSLLTAQSSLLGHLNCLLYMHTQHLVRDEEVLQMHSWKYTGSTTLDWFLWQ